MKGSKKNGSSILSVLSDKELMLKLKKGDITVLGELYKRHHREISRLAYRILGEWNAAEDVMQETFLRIQRAADTYQPTAEFTAWVYRIVFNLCLDNRRRYKRFLDAETRNAYIRQIKNNMDLQGSLQENKAIDQLFNALKKLPQRQRQAVILHKLQGLSHNQISARTGWSQSSIESLLVRAYRKLRTELSNTDLKI